MKHILFWVIFSSLEKETNGVATPGFSQENIIIYPFESGGEWISVKIIFKRLRNALKPV